METIQIGQSINLQEDVRAWYAIGHHDAQKFLEALPKRKLPCAFSIHQVRWIWAELHASGFWEVEEPTAEAQAMTVVEDLASFW